MRKTIEINTGFVCNMDCKFCVSSGTNLNIPGFTPIDTIKKEVSQFATKGYTAMGLLGGEPTIHPQFFDILTHARSEGYDLIHIISNGRSYKNMEFLKKCIDAGANRFSVSIHSHIERLEDFLTSRDGGFREKIAGLQNLLACHKEGLFDHDVSLNLVITRQNLSTLPQSLLYFYKMGFRTFRFNCIQVSGHAIKNFRLVVPKYADVAKTVMQIIKLGKHLGITPVFEGLPFCLVYDTIPDIEHYIGEIRDGRISVRINQGANDDRNRDKFHWDEKRRYIMKTKCEACVDCIFNEACEGVWREYVEAYGAEEFHAITERKDAAVA